MSVRDCCWHWQDTVLAAGCQRIYLSIYLLPTPLTPQSTCFQLRYTQLVTLSLFSSLSTVHSYTLQTSALVKSHSPCPLLSELGHTPSPIRADAFTDDPLSVSSEIIATVDSNFSSVSVYSVLGYTRRYRMTANNVTHVGRVATYRQSSSGQTTLSTSQASSSEVFKSVNTYRNYTLLSERGCVGRSSAKDS